MTCSYGVVQVSRSFCYKSSTKNNKIACITIVLRVIQMTCSLRLSRSQKATNASHLITETDNNKKVIITKKHNNEKKMAATNARETKKAAHSNKKSCTRRAERARAAGRNKKISTVHGPRGAEEKNSTARGPDALRGGDRHARKCPWERLRAPTVGDTPDSGPRCPQTRERAVRMALSGPRAQRRAGAVQTPAPRAPPNTSA